MNQYNASDQLGSTISFNAGSFWSQYCVALLGVSKDDIT